MAQIPTPLDSLHGDLMRTTIQARQLFLDTFVEKYTCKSLKIAAPDVTYDDLVLGSDILRETCDFLSTHDSDKNLNKKSQKNLERLNRQQEETVKKLEKIEKDVERSRIFRKSLPLASEDSTVLSNPEELEDEEGGTLSVADLLQNSSEKVINGIRHSPYSLCHSHKHYTRSKHCEERNHLNEGRSRNESNHLNYVRSIGRKLRRKSLPDSNIEDPDYSSMTNSDSMNSDNFVDDKQYQCDVQSKEDIHLSSPESTKQYESLLLQKNVKRGLTEKIISPVRPLSSFKPLKGFVEKMKGSRILSIQNPCAVSSNLSSSGRQTHIPASSSQCSFSGLCVSLLPSSLDENNEPGCKFVPATDSGGQLEQCSESVMKAKSIDHKSEPMKNLPETRELSIRLERTEVNPYQQIDMSTIGLPKQSHGIIAGNGNSLESPVSFPGVAAKIRLRCSSNREGVKLKSAYNDNYCGYKYFAFFSDMTHGFFNNLTEIKEMKALSGSDVSSAHVLHLVDEGLLKLPSASHFSANRTCNVELNGHDLRSPGSSLTDELSVILEESSTTVKSPDVGRVASLVSPETCTSPHLPQRYSGDMVASANHPQKFIEDGTVASRTALEFEIVTRPPPTASVTNRLTSPASEAEVEEPVRGLRSAKREVRVRTAKPAYDLRASESVSKVGAAIPASKVRTAKAASKGGARKPTSKVAAAKLTSKVGPAKPPSKARTVKPSSKAGAGELISNVRTSRPLTRYEAAKQSLDLQKSNPISNVRASRPVSMVRTTRSVTSKKTKKPAYDGKAANSAPDMLNRKPLCDTIAVNPAYNTIAVTPVPDASVGEPAAAVVDTQFAASVATAVKCGIDASAQSPATDSLFDKPLKNTTNNDSDKKNDCNKQEPRIRFSLGHDSDDSSDSEFEEDLFGIGGSLSRTSRAQEGTCGLISLCQQSTLQAHESGRSVKLINSLKGI